MAKSCVWSPNTGFWGLLRPSVTHSSAKHSESRGRVGDRRWGGGGVAAGETMGFLEVFLIRKSAPASAHTKKIEKT